MDAILFNVEHALHASSNSEFLSNMSFLNDVLRGAKQRYAELAAQVAAQYERAERTLKDFSYSGLSAVALNLDCFRKISGVRRLAEDSLTTGTLFGYDAAIRRLREGFGLLASGFEEYKQKFVQHHQSAAQRADGSLQEALRREIATVQSMRTPLALAGFVSPQTSAQSSVVWRADGKKPVYSFSRGKGFSDL